MIIFDLDGTLADCEHRRHFVDASKNPNYIHGVPPSKRGSMIMIMRDYHKETGEIFEPDWKSFYEACDNDEPIDATIQLFSKLYETHFHTEIQIWSGRCESVKKNTLMWLMYHINPTYNFFDILKMRPIGDKTPDDKLKESWLDEALSQGKTIDYIFEDRPRVIRMWQRRGVFVFDVCQHDQEF